MPKRILEAAKYGCINVHASLLPKYRGAAPIQWSVINGDKETGVTVMQMDEGLDTGDIFRIEKLKSAKMKQVKNCLIAFRLSVQTHLLKLLMTLKRYK